MIHLQRNIRPHQEPFHQIKTQFLIQQEQRI